MPDPFRTAYYDAEAPAYDESRGGRARASAAAEAIRELAPGGGRCLDVAGGTGIVATELETRGWEVLVVDRSAGMLALAAGRLPGRVVRADASRLPVADAAVDVVLTLWLLHLLPRADADSVAAEAVRVLRPGGRWVTSIDKDLSHVGERRSDNDDPDRLAALVAGEGMVPVGATSFGGSNRWRGPGGAAEQVFGVAAFEKRPS